jgi:phosphoenolpyruvate-protein kinase (PTS system EI component)
MTNMMDKMPAAAITMDQLSQAVNFVSIGSKPISNQQPAQCLTYVSPM